MAQVRHRRDPTMPTTGGARTERRCQPMKYPKRSRYKVRGAARRAPELGVRLALGAKPTQLVHSTVLRGMIPVIVGLVAGATLALGLAGALSTLVYRVEPNDPGVLAAVVALMFLVSAAATYLPARRISRIDPAGSLRAE